MRKFSILTRFFAVALAVLLWSRSASGVYFWDQPQNTSGNTSPTTNGCFLYASAAFDIQCYTPGTGLTLGASALTVNLSTGIAGGQAAIGGTGTTDTLTLKATNATPASGAKIYFQTQFGNSYYDPVVGTMALGDGGTPISLFKAAAQLISKSGGELDIGTVDGHPVVIETNATQGIVVDSGQHVFIPILGGVGNQCVEVDNTGQLFGTGAVCGTGGGGGGTVTSVTGTAPISCSPSSPNPVCSLALASDMTVTAGLLTQSDYPLVSRSTNAPANAVNMGALASGVTEQTVSAGVATPLIFSAAANDIPFGAPSGGGFQQSSLFNFNGATMGVDTATPLAGTGIHVDLSTNSIWRGMFMTNSNSGASAGVGWALGLNPGALTNSSYGILFGATSSLGGIYAPSSTVFETTAAGGMSWSLFNAADYNWYTTTGQVRRASLLNAGNWNWSAMVAPGTPAPGSAALYIDSTSKNLAVKNDLGVINHGVQTHASAGGICLSGVADDGSWTGQAFQAPLTACTDYVSLSCVTGATDLGGTNATPTVTAVESAALLRGRVDVTEISAPTVPSPGKLRCYGDAIAHTWTCESSVPTTTHGMQSTAGVASNWVRRINDDGSVGFSQPTYADLGGGLSKWSYSLQLQLSASVPNTWLLQGGPGLFINSALIEYPNDFKAGNIQVIYYLRSNVITAGILTVQASLNGTAISGSAINLTSASATGVHSIGPLSTGSTSSSDTYGIFFSTNNAFASTSPTSVFLTFEVVLTP